MKNTKLNWIEPDETDAIIYVITSMVDMIIPGLDTTSIKRDVESIKSAKKYLSQKLNIIDNFAIL